MKNSKERQNSKVVTVESGVCEKFKIIDSLKSLYKEISVDEAAEIFYKGVLRNMDIEPSSSNYLSEIKNKLNENLNLYSKLSYKDENTEKFTKMIRFFIKHESISNFFFESWNKIIILNPNSLQYKRFKENNSYFDGLTVDTLHFKINRDGGEFKVLLSLSEKSGVSNNEIEFYLEGFANFVVALVKDTIFEAYISTSLPPRSKVFEIVEQFIRNKLDILTYHCFLGKYLIPENVYFDYQKYFLKDDTFDLDDYIGIRVEYEDIISGFDFWNLKEEELKFKILKSVKKSIKLKIEYLLGNNFDLHDVFIDRVPISFLTDLEIIESLRGFDQPPVLLFSKDQNKIKRKDQLVRLTLLLKDVMIENLGNIT